MPATLDDVLAEMKSLVQLGNVQNTIQTVNQSMLTGIFGLISNGAVKGLGGAGGGATTQAGQGQGGWSF